MLHLEVLNGISRRDGPELAVYHANFSRYFKIHGVFDQMLTLLFPGADM